MKFEVNTQLENAEAVVIDRSQDFLTVESLCTLTATDLQSLKDAGWIQYYPAILTTKSVNWLSSTVLHYTFTRMAEPK